jgi:hypothetical protein
MPTPIGPGTASNSGIKTWIHCASHAVEATLTSRQLIWSAHSNSESPSSNTISWLREWLPSPLPVLTALWLAHSHLAAEEGRLPSLKQASPLWLELCRHSSGVPCHIVMALLRAPQYRTGYRTPCLPARLYALLLTAVNICYRNLRGCFFEYWNQHPRYRSSITDNPHNVLHFRTNIQM